MESCIVGYIQTGRKIGKIRSKQRGEATCEKGGNGRHRSETAKQRMEAREKKKGRRLRFAQTAAYMSRSVSRVLLSYGHLSRRTVAGTLQPPRERPGRPIAPIPVLLRIEFTAADAFTRRRVSSYLAFPPLPAAPQSPQPAVYLCCTFPEVAFGGRYPLSLPCGARTFLMDRLSPLSPRPSDLLIYYNKGIAPESQPRFSAEKGIELHHKMGYNKYKIGVYGGTGYDTASVFGYTEK